MKNPTNLKNVYTEQTTKLQHKHQQECELLEDLRLFSKQRSIIEKEYAQSLTKLAQQFLTKRSLPTNPTADDGKPKRTGRSMHEVWVTVLEETEKVGKIRLQASEVYMQQISEACKPIRTVKMQVAKKVFENLAELQKELAVSVADVTKLHKLYKDEEHIAHDVRSKAADADDKVKKKSIGIFTSMSKLQQQSAKLTSRKDACQVKSTTARNDYLMSLAAIKSHVHRYYNNDMPEIIKAMDGDIYECMQEYFTAFCQAELNSCGVTQECFMRILADSTKVNRDFQLNCFLKEHPIFTEAVQYNFQPTDNDQVTKVSLDYQCKSAIEAEAHKWACKFVSDDRELRVAQRKLQRLLNQGNIMTNMDSTEPATSTSVIEQQTKIEEMRHIVRKAMTERCKAESRLEVIRQGDLDIDEFINHAKMEGYTPEEEEDSILSPPPSSHSSKATPALTPAPVINKPQETAKVMTVAPEPVNHYQDDAWMNETTNEVADWDYTQSQLISNTQAMGFESNFGESEDPDKAWTNDQYPVAEVSANSTQQQYETQFGFDEDFSQEGQPAVALYPFESHNSDELSLKEGDSLQIFGVGVDGWIKARDTFGNVGLVPESYIQIGESSGYAAANDPYSSYQTDYTTTTQYSNTDYMNGYQQPIASGDELYQGTGVTGYSENDIEVQTALTTSISGAPNGEGMWARALYDYYASNDEELTFVEGELIRILRKELHDGVDDGWWEGEYNGKIGVFPSLVVEMLDQSTHELESPNRPGPPEFAPPDIFAPINYDGDDKTFEDAPQLEITVATPTHDDEDEEGDCVVQHLFYYFLFPKFFSFYFVCIIIFLQNHLQANQN